MKKIKTAIAYLGTRPILTGVFTVCLTIVFGMSIAFATGLVTPSQVMARVIDPSLFSILDDSGEYKITICHATSSETNPYVRIVTDQSSTKGHFDEHGTPQAGHEEDILLSGDVSCPTPPLQPTAPTCTLTTSPTSITASNASALSWTTINATSLSISHSVGSVTPVSSGSTSVSPTVTTLYTGVAIGLGGTGTCSATITVTPPPPPPTCTLVATPAQVGSSENTSLSWTTTRGSSFSLNQGIGAVSPVSAGSTTTPAITSNTTFTGTVTSVTGQTATCAVVVSVRVNNGGDATCSLAVSPSSYVTGSSAILSWSGSRILNVDIDNGIATATTSTGSVAVSPTALGIVTYTGKFHAINGQTLTCTTTLEVKSAPVVGCTSNCGGGGGGGGGSRPTTPNVFLSSVPFAGQVAGASIYLSQIPYTGLDLGPLGTTLYWLALIGWSLALAYLVLFGAAPFSYQFARTFGERISDVLNVNKDAPIVEHIVVSPVVESVSRREREPEEESPAYSSFDGFKSFAKSETLSIEDIVKGLARAHKVPLAPMTEPIYENVEPIYDRVESVLEEVSAPVESRQFAESAAVSADVRGFTSALVQGDREGVFAGLRQHVRGGGAPEALISAVACHLDDAYRSRVDGTHCDADLVRLTARHSTTTLEKLVASLTTAIDSSYSNGVTGAKLALTRALAHLGA